MSAAVALRRGLRRGRAGRSRVDPSSATGTNRAASGRRARRRRGPANRDTGARAGTGGSIIVHLTGAEGLNMPFNAWTD